MECQKIHLLIQLSRGQVVVHDCRLQSRVRHCPQETPPHLLDSVVLGWKLVTTQHKDVDDGCLFPSMLDHTEPGREDMQGRTKHTCFHVSEMRR
jgi:hypothetical protein